MKKLICTAIALTALCISFAGQVWAGSCLDICKERNPFKSMDFDYNFDAICESACIDAVAKAHNIALTDMCDKLDSAKERQACHDGVQKVYSRAAY